MFNIPATIKVNGTLTLTPSGPVDPIAGFPVVYRLQTHLGDNVPLGLYKDVACSSPATLNGDIVAAWRDELSGSGITATQATLAKRPVLTFVGGVPTLVFSPAADGNAGSFLDLGDLSALIPSEATLVAAVTPVSSGLSDGSVLYDHNNQDQWWNYNPGSTAYVGTLRSSRVNGWPAAGTPASGNHVLSLLSSTSTYDLRHDGTSYGAQAAAYEAGTQHVIGNRSNGIARGYDGAINAVLLRATTETVQLAMIEAYLTTLLP